MEEKKQELIERYLLGIASIEEIKEVEDLTASDEETREALKTMSLSIVAIEKVWLVRDGQRIDRIKKNSAPASMRFWAATAAMLIVAAACSAAVISPVYKFVVKPMIEDIRHKQPRSTETPVADTTVTMTDSIAKENTVEENAVAKEKPVAAKKVETDIKKEPARATETKQDKPQPEADLPKPASSVEQTKPQPKPIVTIPEENKIITTNQLEDYDISAISAWRTGDKITCTFTMTNTEEDAEIQMHTARAKDGNNKVYDAKYCQLNGKTSRIIEKWKQGEAHKVEITVFNVPSDMNYFKQVSFSFQSKGIKKRQVSKSIILEVGDIK